MSKFPMLNLYQVIAVILAVIVLIGGVLIALSTASASYSGFNLGAFFVALLPFLGTAFGFGVAAELIQLLLNVEDHLDHIRQASERQAAQSVAIAKAVTNTASTLPRSESLPGAASNPQAPSSNTPAYEVTVRIQAKVATPIRTKPGIEAASSSQLNSGQAITVYGRNSEGTWLTIGRAGKLWINASDVAVIDGYVNNLPVMQPAE